MFFLLYDKQLLWDQPNVKVWHVNEWKPCHGLRFFLQILFCGDLEPHSSGETIVNRFQTPVRCDAEVKAAWQVSRLPGLVTHERVG